LGYQIASLYPGCAGGAFPKSATSRRLDRRDGDEEYPLVLRSSSTGGWRAGCRKHSVHVLWATAAHNDRKRSDDIQFSLGDRKRASIEAGNSNCHPLALLGLMDAASKLGAAV
jgi:hypothetical protein